jgi:hypothetical protein
MSDVWRQQIPGTDLEINWNLNGNDLIVRVNKGPTMIARMILRDAAKKNDSRTADEFQPLQP